MAFRRVDPDISFETPATHREIEPQSSAANLRSSFKTSNRISNPFLYNPLGEITMRSSMPFERHAYQPAATPKKPKRHYAPIFTLLLVSALSGCAVFQKCQSDACADDAKITADVQTRFQGHPELQAPNRVRVQTVNHVVYLTGRVSEGLQRDEAESLARETQGVTKVVNSIAVSH
jgi:hypothetical protein